MTMRLKLKDDPSVFDLACYTIGGAIGASLFGAITVGVAAFGGWMVAWAFPQTFAAFMTAIGLGQFALWQLSAVMAYIALTLKSFSK